eukprot:TRINITY_DN4462_c0_g1_i1.p1 TRINITY_DN4462_c0_g1~~TRINITY_DN4462_c0_g1_i1.p1  ORF type:complete len:638 (+),score=68.52 TRINITY_DN4462_c0_g1_i1:543-2456(+)
MQSHITTGRSTFSLDCSLSIGKPELLFINNTGLRTLLQIKLKIYLSYYYNFQSLTTATEMKRTLSDDLFCELNSNPSKRLKLSHSLFKDMSFNKISPVAREREILIDWATVDIHESSRGETFQTLFSLIVSDAAVQVKEHALGTLANLAQFEIHRKTIIEVGGVSVLVKLINFGSPSLQKLAAGVVANLVYEIDTRSVLSTDEVLILSLVNRLETSTSQDLFYVTCAMSNLLLCERVRDLPLVKQLIPKFFALSTLSNNVQRYALMCLLRLASSDNSRKAIIKADGIKLITRIQSSKVKIQSLVLDVLHLLLLDEIGVHQLKEMNGSYMLSKWLKNPNSQIQSKVIKTILSLSQKPENCLFLACSDIIVVTLRKIHTPEANQILHNLSNEETVKALQQICYSYSSPVPPIVLAILKPESCSSSIIKTLQSMLTSNVRSGDNSAIYYAGLALDSVFQKTVAWRSSATYSWPFLLSTGVDNDLEYNSKLGDLEICVSGETMRLDSKILPTKFCESLSSASEKVLIMENSDIFKKLIMSCYYSEVSISSPEELLDLFCMSSKYHFGSIKEKLIWLISGDIPFQFIPRLWQIAVEDKDDFLKKNVASAVFSQWSRFFEDKESLSFLTESIRTDLSYFFGKN